MPKPQPAARTDRHGRPQDRLGQFLPRGDRPAAVRVVVVPTLPPPARREPGVVYLAAAAGGGWLATNPSPLAGLTLPARRRMLLGVLESLALGGDRAALTAWLAERRWQVEMRQGRAPQRSTVEHVGEIRVVDDLGHGPSAARLVGRASTRLPAGAVDADIEPGDSSGPTVELEPDPDRRRMANPYD